MKNLYLIIVFIALSNFRVMAQTSIESVAVEVSDNERAQLEDSLKDFSVLDIDLDGFNNSISKPEGSNLKLNLAGINLFEIVLYPNDITSPEFFQSMVTDEKTYDWINTKVVTYKGNTSNGDDVRITLDEDYIYGGITLKDGLLLIKQLRYFLKDETIPENRLIIYYSHDIKSKEGFCGTDMTTIDKAEEQDYTKSSSSGCHIIEIALDCDTEFWNIYNSNSTNQMLGEINMIQNMYERDLDVILTVTSVHVFIGSFYTASGGTGILNEINSLWTSAPYSGISRDLVHHYSGKSIPGPLWGQASGIGQVCDFLNPRAFTADAIDGFYTTAHEIGHLIYGRHSDGQSCSSPTTRSTMCVGEENQLFFSNASISRINGYLNSRNCVDFNTTVISGDSEMCLNNTRNYTLTNLQLTSGTTITWNANSKLSIISGQGTKSVVVKGVGSGFGSLSANINYPGNCGTVTETKNILVGPPLMSISVNGPDSSGWITATASGGSSPYTWTLNNSTTWTTSSATTNRYVGCNGGYLYVQSANSCGTGNGSAFIQPCSGGYYSTVYPNPSSNEINVVESKEFKDSNNGRSGLKGIVTLTLFDMNGSAIRILSLDGRKEEIKMNVSDVMAGNYFLLINGKDIEEVHQIIIR